jgi:hypothetical protein
VPRDHVDDGRGHEERGDLAGIVAFEEGVVHHLDGGQAADARAGDHAHAVEVGLLEVHARIGHGIHARGDAVVHELVHAPGFLRRQVLVELEVLHGAAEAAGEIGRVETGDRRDAAHAIDDIGPGRLHGAAHRGNDAKASNDYATLAQGSSEWLQGQETVPARPADCAAHERRTDRDFRRTIRPWRADR